MSETSLENKPKTVASLLATPDIQKRFQQMLGEKAAGFMSSIISLYNTKRELKECDPNSIVAAAAVAATLDLPINPNLGFAAIVPYKGYAQFQMMAKGFIQLALRTGKYETIHATDVYKDEIKRWDNLTGDFEATDPATHKMRAKGKPEDLAGYLAFFRLTNGFRKYYYMTIDQIQTHAKKYSKSYSNPEGMWLKNPHVMSIKTVTKLLLSKYGILSIQMEKAIDADQAVVDTSGEFVYPDRAEEEPVATKPSGAEKLISEDQLKLFFARIDKSGIERDEVKLYLKTTFHKEHFKDMNVEELSKVLKWLEQAPEAAA